VHAAQAIFSVGEPHPSKQGLKHTRVNQRIANFGVGEPHPSKQGLKLGPHINTNPNNCGRRAPSIKTRIETLSAASATGTFSRVGEPHPSKQGLKPVNVDNNHTNFRVGEPHPSKQGLKLGEM